MNFVFLTGRLVKDPEIRYNKETAVATFTVAVDRFTKGEKTADFFKCVAFKRTAELVDQYCIKGSPIIIDGELRNNNWEDKDGKKHYENEVLVNRVEFQKGKERVVNARDIEPGDDYSEIADDVELPF